MIRAAVLSSDEQFNRAMRRHAADAGVGLELILRSAEELRASGDLDVVIVHQPSVDDIESIKSRVGGLPIVVACQVAFHPDVLRAQEGWAVVSEDDAPGVVAAARAASFGLSVVSAREGVESGEDTVEYNESGEYPPSSVSGPASKLTSREDDVLRLIASGATNQEIAARLGISDNTVKYHLGGLYSKLGATRRSEAIFLAIRKGLISI